MPSTINPAFLPYLPPSYLDSQGGLTVSVAQATVVATDIQARADSLPPVEKQLFLDLVAQDASQLAPRADAPPADLDATLSRLECAAQNLQTFLSEAVNPAALALVLIELASDERTSALDDRLSAMQQAQSDLLAQAADDTSSANDLLKSATTGLALGVVASTISIIGSAVSLGGGMKSLAALKGLAKDALGAGEGEADDIEKAVEEAEDLGKNVTQDGNDPSDNTPAGNNTTGQTQDQQQVPEIKSQSSDSGSDPQVKDSAKPSSTQKDEEEDFALPPKHDLELETIRMQSQVVAATAGVFSAVSQALNSGGSFVTTEGQADSKIDEADGERAAALAQQAQAQATIAQGIQQSLDDLITSDLQYVSDVLSGTSQAMQAIVRG